ncbi:hypothetical protein AVEN_125806-1 [Araneus ventricosus]|uniref:CCHC-type domain-containing protein n=1 Tax=Araneus ventricosus TaxID=182803 RepID=A0A4Y2RV99_ARAVE|nr:hypothetical protein AVEN_125806-1 [Araneus ventricosus]
MPSGLNLSQYHMGPLANHNCNAYSKFFVINSENNTLKNTSPILIHKSIVSFVGEAKSVKKLNNGSLLIEVTNSKQAENIQKLKKIGNIEVTVTPHRTLNYSKGVISESEFQRDLEEDLLNCLKDQKVISVRRITIKKNGQNFPTKHLILTFNTPVLPKSVKIAYINCNVKHYIPNPLRCFKCQRFGHTLTACRSKQNCARCSLPDHDSNNCSSTTPKCSNVPENILLISNLAHDINMKKRFRRLKLPKTFHFLKPVKYSSPVKKITKQSRENKKQEKKSNEWVKVKETKAAKRARQLAEKSDQVFSHSLPNRFPSREDFLKDSVKEGKNNDDDSLLKVYPSDDDMSTGEVEDLLLSP